MLLQNTPSLGAINGPAAKLRVQALKLQNYAVLNWRNGGDFGRTLLASFWDSQVSLAAKDSGTPFDGLYLGDGVEDIRKECYLVQSAVRMYNRPLAKETWLEFCNFWKGEASALVSKNSAVTELRINVPAKGVVPELSWDGSLEVDWSLHDSEGTRVVASNDNPLRGNVVVTFPGGELNYTNTVSGARSFYPPNLVGQVEGTGVFELQYVIKGVVSVSAKGTFNREAAVEPAPRAARTMATPYAAVLPLSEPVAVQDVVEAVVVPKAKRATRKTTTDTE